MTVASIFPANDFKVVARNAAEEIKVVIVIGYDENDQLCVFGGGLFPDFRQPSNKDFLYMVEQFKANLMAGQYDPE